MSFDLLYRPKRFDEVFGQTRVVELLRSLIHRNKLERNIMFIGDRGSGKTSLARLYARALNCEQNDADGSPCGRCPACSDPHRDALFEYDTAGEGGDRNSVTHFVRTAKHATRDCRVRVIFFDEAHVLEDDAADSLLKEIEEPKPGIVFCFATTAPGALRDALISRLMVFEVRALSNQEAIRLLRSIAERAKIDCEPAALATLSAAKRNYPRDLLIGLEQVIVEGRRLTVEDVKTTFGIDQVDALVGYFTALADGEDGVATQSLEGWHERPLQKAEWIRNFVLSLYYNNVLGRDVIVDPLIYADVAQHTHILERLEARLGPKSGVTSVSFWLGLVRFWVRHRPVDDSTAFLTIALFQTLVIAGEEYRPDQLQRAPVSLSRFDPSTLLAGGEQANLNDAIWDEDVSADFIGPNDVTSIIRAASEFVQHTGRLFNVSLRVHSSAGLGEEYRALDELGGFVGLLEQEGAETSHDSEPFAAITLFETGDHGYFAIIAAFVPGLDTRAGTKRFVSFLKEAKSRGGAELRIDRAFASGDARRDLNFHWDAVLDLCASAYEPRLERSLPGEKGLLDRLKVPKKRREPRPLMAPRIRYSGMVGDGSLQLASQSYGMAFLSAIDDEAFGWIKKGWELDEYEHRVAAIAERRKVFEEIALTHDDPKRRREAHHEALRNWGGNARRRPGRKWKVWWGK